MTFTLNIPRIARSEQGATLVETLVAISMGVLVIGATMGILVIALHQNKRITDRVSADQRGRVAMTRIVNELHSACLSAGFTPVLSGSTENELRFVNAYSKEAIIASAEAAEHRIVYSSSTESLRDFKYVATGGSWPNYTFSGTATPSAGTLFASNVTKTESKPIFAYYKYSAAGTAGTETASSSTLTALTPPLTTTTAPQAASATVNFTIAPSNGSTQRGRQVPFTAQVTLAFSAPSSETPIQAAPCE
jgi:Tfp pilus assembly protein PilW